MLDMMVIDKSEGWRKREYLKSKINEHEK